jgi:uncharacterized protein (TIGR02996 family)
MSTYPTKAELEAVIVTHADYPTNAALEAAIVAHADEDTPRLAYADWLDENGDPDRAAFIRVQCRLAEMSPAEPDWVDLTERQLELEARLKSRLSDLQPPEPEQFYFGYDYVSAHEEPFRRGFPHFIDCQVDSEEWTPEETTRVIEEITELVRTTTLRGFQPYEMPVESLTQLLAAPVALKFTGLSLRPYTVTDDWEGEQTAFHRLIATSPALRRVRELYLYGAFYSGSVNALANATMFDSVRRMTIQSIQPALSSTITRLTKAAWFRRLQHFRSHLSYAASAVPLLTGLGKLPVLHTLELPEIAATAVKNLAAGKFPALARLIYDGPLGLTHARTLARARFPALVAFEADGGLKNDGLAALLKAKWFGQLRVLDLTDNAIGDQGVKALAAHPVASTLRFLRLGDNPFGKSALTAFARPGAFPTLTTLSLHSYHKRKGTAKELAACLSALQLPNLRHLDLMGWPLGNDGAKALAANPAFATLTRLNLDSCGISDTGAKALFASPHLQKLVELQMSDNSIKSAADALKDPAVMPRLGECWLSGNKITEKSAKKLERDGLYLIT